MRKLFSEWTESQQRVGYYPTVTDRQLWKSLAGCRPEAEGLILTELFHLKPEGRARDKPSIHVPTTSDSTTSMNILCSMGSDIITFTEEEERRSGGRWQQRNTRLD